MIEKDQKCIGELQQDILQKLATFLQYHQVKIQQIWGQQSSISVNMFSEVMEQNFGYKISVDEFMGLRKLSKTGDNLSFQNFHILGLWKNAFYKGQYRKKQKIRPQTATNFTNKLFTKQNTKLTQSKALTQQFQQSTLNLIKNSRFKQANQQLQKKILENALDKKWEYLIKVGQMNSWKKQTKVSQRSKTVLSQKKNNQQNVVKNVYQIQGQYQDIKIIQQKQNGESQILPLKVFDQKYQAVKKKFTHQQKQKNNMKDTMILVLDKKDKVSKTKLCQRISQRDQQLNYVLLQIMRMKNIFEQQEQILTECGVNT